MRYLRLIPLFLISIILFAEDMNSDGINKYIKRTQAQFEKANNYQVTMEIELKIPGFRMPKKKYEVFFQQPDKVKIKSRGFGMLPKTGLFTSPKDNFDNLKNMHLINQGIERGTVFIKGDVIIDSLKLKMPNEYAKLGFRPSVTVKIDTVNWVIHSIVTELDTLKLVEINNSYDIFQSNYIMPTKSTVQYFVKDAKLSSWLKKDISSIVGQSPISKKNDMVEGLISIIYKDYRINEGIDKNIFKD